MSKVDLRKDLKALYQPSAKAVVDLRVPSMTYLTMEHVIDGMWRVTPVQEYGRVRASGVAGTPDGDDPGAGRVTPWQ